MEGGRDWRDRHDVRVSNSLHNDTEWTTPSVISTSLKYTSFWNAAESLVGSYSFNSANEV